MRGNSKNDSKWEGKDEVKELTEVVSINLVPNLAQFLQSPTFRRAIDGFYDRVMANEKFCLYEGKAGEVVEYSHELKEIFDQFENVVDAQLTRFADDENVPLSTVFQCCKDTVDGRYAPLFGEDEHLWVVEMLLSYLDFHHFLRTMQGIASKRSND
eukprot:gene31402-37959_t